MSMSSDNLAPQAASSTGRHQMVDPEHGGTVVATFEHPAGWRAQSQVVWNYQNASAPVWLYAATFDPNGAAALEFLSPEAFYWLEPNSGFNPVGQSRYGVVCMPPMPAADAMTRLVIPKYRGTKENLRVTTVAPMPNLPQLLNDQSLMQSPNECVAVGLGYEENGRALDEEWYGVKTQQQAGGGSSTQINWGFGRLLCFRAACGELEAARPTFWQIARSAQPNPEWQALFNAVVQQLNAQHGAMIAGGHAKLQGEAQLQGQLTNYYQEQRDHQNADIAAKIESDRRRQKTSQPALAAQEAWRNELGGETAYHDPNSSEGNVIYHRSGDRVVWMNEDGEIDGSEDPNHDPNIGSTKTWRRLDQA